MTKPETNGRPQIAAIVDDRPTSRKILERLARSLDSPIEVRVYDRPEPALDGFARELPDLLITDLELPQMEGPAFIRRFRALAGAAEIPVIAITAHGDRELRYRALEAGATDFLGSPVDHREFRIRSQNLLTLRRQQLLLAERASALEARIHAEERRHQDALRESHQLLMRVLDAVPVAVSATDRDGRYVFVNDWLARRLGRPAAAIIGLKPAEVRNDLAAHAAAERDRKIIAGSEVAGTFEETLASPEGRRVLLTTKALLRESGGRPSLVVTASLDITERKDAEIALKAAKDEAELASRSKTEFLANMSHELRTPLNAIIGFSELMAEERMGPLGSARYVGYAADICASAQHLLGVISDILDVSRLDAGKAELDEAEVDLLDLVPDVVQLVSPQARELEVEIALDLATDLPRLRADPTKLKQVLLNLLTNAVKFSGAQSVVTVRARFDDAGFHLAVIDQGVGMDAAEVETAVARFGQVASAWNRRHAGVGLGLPLAIGLVELHGGRLAIASQRGQGTTVSIDLPRDRALPSSAAQSA